MLKKYIVLIILMFSTLFADSFSGFEISSNNKIKNDFEFLYYKSGKSLNVNEVSKKEFKNRSSNNFSLGYVPQELWIKLKIKNSSQNSSFILSVNEHFYEKFNIYYFDGKWIKKENGLFKPIENREIKTNKLYTRIIIPTNEQREYYIQLKV